MKVQSVKYMLMAKDMDRAVAFWTKTFGLKLAFQSPEWTEMKFGDAIVALHGGWDGKRNPTGLGFQVDDIKEAAALAREAGATVLREPVEREGEPIWLADLVDPEGNAFTLSQYKG